MNSFDHYLELTGIYGTVQEVKHPIIYIKGLPNVHPNETIIFEDGQQGQVLDIDHDEIRALLFSNTPTPIGIKVTRTNIQLQIPVGEIILGQTIDPLGTQILSSLQAQNQEYRDVFSPAPGMNARTKIDSPFITGMTKVDLLLPLGKGQRELILGDVKTGKTSLLLSVLENQLKQPDTVAIYAAIGKRRSEIKQLGQRFLENGLSKKLAIIASSSSDAPSIHYLTPYVAMTHAEYFKDKGLNVIVVMDDLSTHAQSYREISLLSQRFPGRDSYPGDIFYAHASLLERAGNFKHPKKGTVSITCLPVATTVEGDLSGYISTNLMGMTDGHILFDAEIYNKGSRPAINIPLSVTRVGRQTQTNLLRTITLEILSVLSQYEKIQNISHLGSELSGDSKRILEKGKALQILLHQEHRIIPREIQIVLFGIVWMSMYDLPDQDVFNYLLGQFLSLYEKEVVRNELVRITTFDKLSQFLIEIKQNPLIQAICNLKKS